MTRPAERGRWGNLWWEVLVALAIVCGLVWVGWRAAQPGGGWILPAVSGRWPLVSVVVAGGAAVIVQFYWPLRRFAVFWAMSVAFLAALGASAYVWFPNGVAAGAERTVYFGIPGGAEGAAFAYLVYRRFHFLPKAGGPRARP